MSRWRLEHRGISNPDVLKAMERVPRERFVPDDLVHQADGDHPLPIGYGQTISQPYIVAVMTELLRPDPSHTVLEVGTGSGYQTAILAELFCRVYTVERIPSLHQRALRCLSALGYGNVTAFCGDGYLGWDDHVPYDAIIVTCAPDHVPKPLIAQLTDGGRLVLPVGRQGATQSLQLVERCGGNTRTQRLMSVAFVPLIHLPRAKDNQKERRP